MKQFFIDYLIVPSFREDGPQCELLWCKDLNVLMFPKMLTWQEMSTGRLTVGGALLQSPS